MAEIRYHIPQFIMGILFGILVISAYLYLSGLGAKIDKISGIEEKIDDLSYKFEIPKPCSILPEGVQEKIEKTYENISSASCEIIK